MHNYIRNKWLVIKVLLYVKYSIIHFKDSENNSYLAACYKKLRAGGRGASASACAGLTNQLLSCWVDPRIAWKNTDTAIVGDRWRGVEGRHAMYC